MDKNEEQYKQEMIDIWDKVALTYGQVGPRYWENLGNRLIELANILGRSKILDIGTGRGASLFPAVEKTGPEGKVIGIDMSREMVNETCKEILKC